MANRRISGNQCIGVFFCLCRILPNVVVQCIFAGDWGCVDIGSPDGKYDWTVLVEISVTILTLRKEDPLVLVILGDLGVLLYFMREPETTFHAPRNTMLTETIVLGTCMMLASVYKLSQVCTVVLSFWRYGYLLKYISPLRVR